MSIIELWLIVFVILIGASSSSLVNSFQTETTDEETLMTTTPNVVLQPNIAKALDVGQGLLVPLVPVIDPNSKTTDTTSPMSPLIAANLLPIAVETVTPNIDSSQQVEINQLDDMDVAEDIIFRPLFKYRQETAARRQYNSNYNRYYQPYIYAYKKRPNYYNYR